MAYPEISKEQKGKMIEYYVDSRKTLAEVGKAFGVSRYCAWKWIKAAGIDTGNKRGRGAFKQAIAKLYRVGVSAEKIKEVYGISEESIKRWYTENEHMLERKAKKEQLMLEKEEKKELRFIHASSRAGYWK